MQVVAASCCGEDFIAMDVEGKPGGDLNLDQSSSNSSIKSKLREGTNLGQLEWT